MIINRVWAMPSKNTFSIKPIRELLERFVDKENKLWLDPFANSSDVATITNDIDPDYNTDYHLDVLEFFKLFKDNSVDGVLFDPVYCYDESTELLTDDGWKSVSDICKEDSLATLNLENLSLEYQNPTEIISRYYVGDMVSIESQSISLFVTPNHRCLVKNRFYGDYRWVEAKDLFNSTKYHWFRKSCNYDAPEVEFFELPEVQLLRHNRYGEKVKLAKKIPMDTWLKFLGLYLSEGSWEKNRKASLNPGRTKYRYVVSISQVKPDVREEIIKVLDELGYAYTINKNSFRIEDKQLWSYVKQFGTSHTVFIPKEFKNLSKRQLTILLHYLMLGDGTNKVYPKLNKTVNKVYSYKTNDYYTGSYRLFNDVCEIGIKCGFGITTGVKYKGNYKPVYKIHFLGAKDFMVHKSKCNKNVQFSGHIYCVSVPNTTVLVRRNGRVFWCGNSPRQLAECYKKLNLSVTKETTQASFWSSAKDEVARVLKRDGLAISFGWNSSGVGKKRGFDIVEILLVPHGSNHNDTIVTVERKVSLV